MSWNEDLTGNYTSTVYGRKCTIAKVTGGSGRPSSWRLSIDGVESSALKNGGVSKEVRELKDLAWEHLRSTVGVQRAKENAARTSQSETRFRAIEVATGIVKSLPETVSTVGPHEHRKSFDDYLRAVLYTASLVMKFSEPPPAPPQTPAPPNSST